MPVRQDPGPALRIRSPCSALAGTEKTATATHSEQYRHAEPRSPYCHDRPIFWFWRGNQQYVVRLAGARTSAVPAVALCSDFTVGAGLAPVKAGILIKVTLRSVTEMTAGARRSPWEPLEDRSRSGAITPVVPAPVVGRVGSDEVRVKVEDAPATTDLVVPIAATPRRQRIMPLPEHLGDHPDHAHAVGPVPGDRRCLVAHGQPPRRHRHGRPGGSSRAPARRPGDADRHRRNWSTASSWSSSILQGYAVRTCPSTCGTTNYS